MDKDYLSSVLNKYFTRLSQIGYVPYDSVYNILILLFVDEYIIPYSDDRETVDRALSCITGSCFIPYTSCNESCNQ